MANIKVKFKEAYQDFGAYALLKNVTDKGVLIVDGTEVLNSIADLPTTNTVDGQEKAVIVQNGQVVTTSINNIGGGGGGVTTLNGLAGAVTLSEGSGIFFDTTGNDIAINAIGSTVPSDTSLAVKVATTAALPGTPTYDNGTAGVGATLTRSSNGTTGTIDGVIAANLIAGDYILVKNQAAQLQNGVYEVTQQGTASLPYILTRVTEADTTAELDDLVVTAALGSTNKGVPYGQQTNNPTIGVSNIVFTATGIYMRQQTTGTQVAGQIPYYTSTALTQTKGDSLMTRNATTKVSQILRPFTYAAGFSFDVDTAPVAIMETSNPFIDGEAVTFYENAQSAVTFTGSGLDDMLTPSDDFLGTYPTTFTATITDTNVSYFNTNGGASGNYVYGETITGSSSGTTAEFVGQNNLQVAYKNMIGSGFTALETVTGSTSGVTSIPLGAGFSAVDTFSVTNGTTTLYQIALTGTSREQLDGITTNFTSDLGHTVTDEWSWTYSASSVGTGTLTHQETGAVLTAQFYSGITGDPSNATYVVGTTSGEQSNLSQYLGNSTFTNGDSVISFSTDYVITGGTITSVPGADNYIISATGGFDQYVILTDADNTKFGGIIASTSTPVNANAQAGFITTDDVLGLGVDGSGILFDNTDSSDYGFTGIFNQNGITGGIYLDQEGIITTLDMSKTGFGLNLNDGSHTTALTMDFENISLYATHPSNSNMTGITIDAAIEVIEIGSLGSKAKISIDNETDGIIELNTSSSPSDPSIQINAQTDKIKFNQAYTFPLSAGSSGQVLALDGSGDLQWATPSSILLKTNGTSNGSQSTLDLISGTGISLADNGFGGVTITNGGVSSFNTLTGSVTISAGSGISLTPSGNNIAISYSGASPAISLNGTTLYSSAFPNTGNTSGNNIFLGDQAGQFAYTTNDSIFLGSGAGANATSADFSNFFGQSAGFNAVGAFYSNFIGSTAGYGATNARNSIFIGSSAGNGATNAAYSIFIGTNAGGTDTVNNATGGSSILIGDYTSTGGYSNSIAIGAQAINTATNQFMIGSTASPINTIVVTGTGGIKVPVGTTGERSVSQGMIRYNTTTSKFEGYDGSTWFDFH